MISISIEFSSGILQARLAFGSKMSLLRRQRSHQYEANRTGLGADAIALHRIISLSSVNLQNISIYFATLWSMMRKYSADRSRVAEDVESGWPRNRHHLERMDVLLSNHFRNLIYPASTSRRLHTMRIALIQLYSKVCQRTALSASILCPVTRPPTPKQSY